MPTEIPCPRCGEYVKPTQVACDCGWILKAHATKAQESSRGCPDCNSTNPTRRTLHWMQLGESMETLREHLRQEFQAYIAKHSHWLSIKLHEISELRFQYLRKYADESGQWLPPHLAWAEKNKAAYAARAYWPSTASQPQEGT